MAKIINFLTVSGLVFLVAELIKPRLITAWLPLEYYLLLILMVILGDNLLNKKA